MYNAFASAQAGWRQPLLRVVDSAPEVAGAMHVGADPAHKPWAAAVAPVAAVGTGAAFALSAPATDARVPVPRGMPLV